MNALALTLLGLSYVVIFILGYALRSYVSAHRRHYH